MESTLIVSSVNPPKKFRCPYFREEGGGQAGCQNVFIFYVIIGGRGSRQINQMSLNIPFPNPLSMVTNVIRTTKCTEWPKDAKINNDAFENQLLLGE